MTTSTPPSTFARIFLLKPTIGILLTALFAASGLLGYSGMVKESNPDIAIPQATVSTSWYGADPQTIEQQVTNKLENEIKSLKGLKRLRSASFDGYSILAVEFDASADIDDSMRQLREKVDDAVIELPDEADAPEIDQISVDDSPVLTFTLFGELPLSILSRVSDDLEDALEKVEGVNRVELSGERDEIIQIRLIPSRLAALGLSPSVVRSQIQKANSDRPWDKIENDEIGGAFRLYGRFRSVEDLQALPVLRLDGGRVVRLAEVADVRRDLEREVSRASLSWHGAEYQTSVEVSVVKVPGADTLAIIEACKAEVLRIRDSDRWYHGLQSEITFDQSEDITGDLISVFHNGWQAMVCVFLVLLVMLTWREALVAGLCIPVTFLGALGVIWLLGFTLNQLTIIGMVLSLGLLVDVFILMMEGMHDAIGEGLSFGRAAIKTVKTYAMPAFAGQMTTVLAMVPLMAIGGIDGKFIRIIPVTAITCLLVSFVVSILIAIPLSRPLLSRPGTPTATAVDRLTKRLGSALDSWLSKYAVPNKGIAALWVLAACATFVIGVLAMGMLPSELYPKSDGRKLGITVELPPSTTLDSTQVCADELGEYLRTQSIFESVQMFTGRKSPMAQNSIGESLTPTKGSYIVGFSATFIPLDDRDQLAFEYLPEIRDALNERLAAYPGSLLVLTPQTGGSSTEDPVQIELLGTDMDRLRQTSAQVQELLRRTPGATDIRDNLGQSRGDIRFVPRRESLDFHGIDQDELADQVFFAMSDGEIGEFPVEGLGDDIEIRMGTAWPSRNGAMGGPSKIEELATLRVFDAEGKATPLFALGEITASPSALSITRKDGRRAVTVQCKTEGRTAGEVFEAVRGPLEEMRATWPSGYDFHFGGQAEASAETFGSAAVMMVLAVFLVFAVLVLQFGSFSQPFIILLSIPFALIGTLLGFFLSWTSFSFPAMIGIISLIGIAVNDAIVMIETMNAHRESGDTVAQSAARGAADRLRPIVTTTLTTVLGLIPLALSSPMWMPLCMAIIYGLSAATVISLIMVPCLFLLLTSERVVTEEDLLA